jgi:hypothetical protein
MKSKKPHISQQELKERFRYKKGNLYYRKARGKCKKDAQAGYIEPTGYTQIEINKRIYRLHRLVWLYHNGVIPDNLCIDHINMNKNDNRIENLRLVTLQENTFNKRDTKGYYFAKNIQKYRAVIELNDKKISLGDFKTEKEARIAYLKAKRKYHQIQVR